MFHNVLALAEIHAIHHWSVADSTALLALSVVAADVGKVAAKIDDATFWILVDDSPATWKNLTPGVAAAPAWGTITGAISGQADVWLKVKQCIPMAVGDDTTAITAGTGKLEFYMPYDFTVAEVIIGLKVAQTSGSIFTVDLNEAGATILSTKLTIDNTEGNSVTAATPAVISDANLAKGSKMSIDVDQIGDGTAKGLTLYLVGRPA